MILRGCSGCSGFSYTLKYKKSMIAFYNWINQNVDIGVVKYQIVQKLIEDSGGCDDSETRMIVPFMIKAGIINKASCEWHGSRMYAINTQNLFTKSGECFIQFLKLEIKREEIENDSVKSVLQNIYEKFAKIQFNFLFNSQDYIYKEMVKFLLKYKTMDKIEFFILCTKMHENDMDNLDELILSYRNKKYDEKKFEIAYNINAYTYTSKLLIQYSLFQYREDKIILNPSHESYFSDLMNNLYEVEGE